MSPFVRSMQKFKYSSCQHDIGNKRLKRWVRFLEEKRGEDEGFYDVLNEAFARVDRGYYKAAKIAAKATKEMQRPAITCNSCKVRELSVSQLEVL